MDDIKRENILPIAEGVTGLRPFRRMIRYSCDFGYIMKKTKYSNLSVTDQFYQGADQPDAYISHPYKSIEFIKSGFKKEK